MNFIWQQRDDLKSLSSFKDKMFYVHFFKDIKVYEDSLNMALPLTYMALKFPGLGDIDGGRFLFFFF